MSRAAVLLTALLAVALVALSFLFLIKPKMDQVAELEVEAEDIRAQQSQVRSQIAALEQVRATSPNLEAELAAISAIVPSDPALPAILRQLQVAADDAGVSLISVSPGVPTSAGVEAVPELSSIAMNLSLEGGYFQVVDFLRRIEDPVITARGFLVEDVSLTPDEYPTLAVSISGQVFSVLDQAAPATPAEEPTDPDATETDVDVEVEGDEEDVDVDVTVSEEDAA